MNLKEALKEKHLVFDGAFGTYYSELCKSIDNPEPANILNKDVVVKIHKEYIENGADIIRTNTFASNSYGLCECIFNEKSKKIIKDNIKAAITNARCAVNECDADVYIAGSIGPIPSENIMYSSAGIEDITDEYMFIAKCMIEEGVDIIVFETFSEMDNILPVIDYIKNINKDIVTIVEFCVNQYGYTNDGLKGERLLRDAIANANIDVTGFNCGVGPGHLYSLLKDMDLSGDTYICTLPNASYPKIMGNRMIFMKNEEYFFEKMKDIAALGVDIIGGCCGTRPDYIKMLHEYASSVTKPDRIKVHTCEQDENREVIDNSFFAGKEGKKLIAVELAPPVDADYHKVMDAANSLRKCNVDVLTFPDSPSGRTRADSILMAAKIASETGMTVMPHICCRDKNAIAIRSLLLGAQINDITNFLVITGDPVPTLMRQNVKGVFNFDSCGLMKLMNDMNKDSFALRPLTYGGAINQGRANLQFEINRVKKKMAAGAQFFFTQPVFTKEDVARIRRIKEETGARILFGLMPLISKRNATFIMNEMTGINVTSDIVAMYDNVTTKEEGEEVGVAIAAHMMELGEEFADGFYFSIPFNRVYLVERILNYKKEAD